MDTLQPITIEDSPRPWYKQHYSKLDLYNVNNNNIFYLMGHFKALKDTLQYIIYSINTNIIKCYHNIL